MKTQKKDGKIHEHIKRELKFETLHSSRWTGRTGSSDRCKTVRFTRHLPALFHNSKHAADRFGLRDAENIYGRQQSPTRIFFEQRIVALEAVWQHLQLVPGAAAVTYTIENLAQAGDHIVSAKNIYGGTYNLLAHIEVDFSVTTTLLILFNLEEVERKALSKDNTKAVYIETLSNQTPKWWISKRSQRLHTNIKFHLSLTIRSVHHI